MCFFCSYGDKTPRSFLAQVVAIAWMLMGPIINGIVVGAITTSLTSINLESDPKIYGTRVSKQLSILGSWIGIFYCLSNLSDKYYPMGTKLI